METAHFSSNNSLHAKLLDDNCRWETLHIDSFSQRQRFLELTQQSIDWYENFFSLKDEEPYVQGKNLETDLTEVWFAAVKHTYEIEYPGNKGNYKWYCSIIATIRPWLDTNEATPQDVPQKHAA